MHNKFNVLTVRYTSLLILTFYNIKLIQNHFTVYYSNLYILLKKCDIYFEMLYHIGIRISLRKTVVMFSMNMQSHHYKNDVNKSSSFLRKL